MEKCENQLERLVQLENENEEIKIERDDCDKMRLDLIKKHDTQLKALNQNLANLRNELKQQFDKVAQIELNMNTERINYLELEAKYSNCLDERNQLLERCLNSETMCETMSVQKTALQRKLEDTQAALQELGSEHQSLQIQINKKSNYKWVDDSKVNNCEHCKKAFSVTIRKVKFRFFCDFKKSL
jgi:chromosome segregation ATPase